MLRNILAIHVALPAHELKGDLVAINLLGAPACEIDQPLLHQCQCTPLALVSQLLIHVILILQ